MDKTAARARVDALAREWIGTPYHDHGRVKGAGTDCAQLLLAVYAEAGLIPPTDVGHYSPQFFQHQSEERYLGWVESFAREVPIARAQVGDVVLYHIGKCFAHGAIIVAPGWPAIIHAHAASRVVRRGFGNSPHLGMPIKAMKFFSLWA